MKELNLIERLIYKNIFSDINIKIIPSWEDKEIYDLTFEVISNSKRYEHLGTDEIRFPKKNSNQIDITSSYQELHKAFDSEVIFNIYNFANKKKSDLILLNDDRGYGYINIIAEYYRNIELN